MTPLPVLPACTLRGERLADDTFPCTSPFITHAIGRAAATTCVVCPYANKTCETEPTHPLCRGVKKSEPPLPSVASQAWNALTSLARHVVTGAPSANAEKRAAREAVCNGCDRYRKSDGRCSECGCWMATKAAWEGESCPLGKW